MKLLKSALAVVLLLMTTGALLSPWRNAERIRQITAHSTVVPTARGTIEYGEAGSGPAVLVFHGTPGGFDTGLAAAARHLPGGYRIISASRPGYLRTPLGLSRTVEGQADLLASLLDTIGVSRTVVYAFSGGGPFALQFAARHPAKCRGLILSAAVSGPQGPPTPGFVIQAARFTDLASWWMLPALPALARVLTPVDPRSGGWVNDERLFAALPEQFNEHIYRPTLILHGTADRNVDFGQSLELSRRIPEAELVAVQGVGHIGLGDSPEAHAAIARFLAKFAK